MEAAVRIVIGGAPASGKGTQCELILEKYGVVHISTGDLLRAEVEARTQRGQQAQQFMERGSLVPDEILIAMVKERLEQPDCRRRGWLLDGFPRTRAQALALQEAGILPDVFVLVDVPDDVAYVSRHCHSLSRVHSCVSFLFFCLFLIERFWWRE